MGATLFSDTKCLGIHTSGYAREKKNEVQLNHTYIFIYVVLQQRSSPFFPKRTPHRRQVVYQQKGAKHADNKYTQSLSSS